jgi:para-aminobenzoate synthetase component 1
MNDFFNASHVCLLQSNGSRSFYREDEYEFILAIGCQKECRAETNAIETLQQFIDRNRGQWIFGVISYDVKNEIEELQSENPPVFSVPLICFFIPETVILKRKNEPVWKYDKSGVTRLPNFSFPSRQKESATNKPFSFQSSLQADEYLQAIHQLKRHIQYGNIYEITFCLNFFSEDVCIHPWNTWLRLHALSPAPMACYFKAGKLHLISSSPERFLKKKDDRLISQPIKGTIRRSMNREEDNQLKSELAESPKEQSENVMIVDLVRNDLSRVAWRGSVQVDELFGIYSLAHVHQMISTISCRLRPEITFADILRATFPMGSMTGAPKISAMKLIEKYERFRRGWFSGCAGYIDPAGNFDFNVIIRSILYDEEKKRLCFPAGSAITIGSDARKEYEECLLKAVMMRRALQEN